MIYMTIAKLLWPINISNKVLSELIGLYLFIEDLIYKLMLRIETNIVSCDLPFLEGWCSRKGWICL